MNDLIKFDPFAEMQALQKEFFNDDWFTPVRMQMPTTDVYTESDKQLTVEAHLPNFEEKDIDVHVENDFLIIRGEKREQEKDEKKKYVVRESSNSFYRRVRLPDIANTDKIDAHMDEGVLKVVVPFKKLPAPKKISVKKLKK